MTPHNYLTEKHLLEAILCSESGHCGEESKEEKGERERSSYCWYNSSSSLTPPKAIRSMIVSSMSIIKAGVITNSPYLSLILSIASAYLLRIPASWGLRFAAFNKFGAFNFA